MKAFLTRGVALLLAVLMIVTACGCNGKKHDRGDDTFEPLPGEVPVDLEGYEFTVMCHGGADNWNQETSGTPYADAWIQLVDEVEYLYNCDITATAVGWQDMFNVVQPEIAAGGKCADIIISPEHAYGAFLGANLMLDLNEMDVNWDNEWWNQSIRKTTTYNNKSYVGGGSFIFDTRATWLCYVNRAIWDQNGFEDPYELVDSGKWTYDKFREYAIAAAKDNDGSGKLDSSEDVYGVIAANGDFCDAWFQAMGGHFFKADEEDGKVVLACNTTRTYEIVEKMYNMIQKDNVYGFLGLGEVEHVQQFTGGGALFYCYTVGKDGLQDMEDDWFVLPMPKFDEAQDDYITLAGASGGRFISIPVIQKDIERTGIILEALAAESVNTVKTAFYDFCLTGKYVRDDESSEMLDIIFEGKKLDWGYIINVASMNSQITALEKAKNNDPVSAFTSLESQVNTLLTQYMEHY